MSGAGTPDDAERRRLRWRARRGMLENDLLIGRFLDRCGDQLAPAEAQVLGQLLTLPDTDLFDILLSRKEPVGELDTIAVRELLARIRSA